MSSNKSFTYYYSAKENREIQEIRNKYQPNFKTKLEEVKYLDRQVQTAGHLMSLIIGVIGCLVFGLGLCMTIEIIGDYLLLGFFFAVVGTALMISAYPIYRLKSSKVKAELTPSILKLLNEISVKI